MRALPFTISPVGRRRFRRGFSLVITLLMMVLLSTIALGLLSLSTVSLRSAGAGAADATARANARLALMLALGQNQKMAGQDTRATGSAAQLELQTRAGAARQSQEVAQPHWVGVWPTTVEEKDRGFLVGRYGSDSEKMNYLVDLRNASTPDSGSATFDGTRKEFDSKGQLGWLVSSAGDADPDPVAFAGEDKDSKVLLGMEWEKSGSAELKKKVVRAPLVPIGGDQPGAYSYWVSDESQKANIAVDNAQPASSSNPLAVTQNAQADLVDNLFKGHGALARKSNSVVKSMPSFNSSALLPLGGSSTDLAKRLPEFVHDLTATSVGLLTNPQTGGYQQDLSAFLARSEEITEATALSSSSPGFGSDSQLGAPALSIGTPLVEGNRHASTSPRFGALKAWADLSKKVTGAGVNAQIPATLPPITTSHPFRGPDITRIAAQPVQPILAEFTVGYDFSPIITPQPGRPPDKDGLRLHMYPRVVLWNPYNVAISAPRYVAIMRFDPRVTLKIRGTTVSTPHYLKNSSSHSSYPYLLSMAEEDETITQNCVGFMTEATIIPAGQSLVFTPNPSGGTDVIAGTAARYNSRQLEKNLLTCQNPPGQENFYADAPIRPSGTNSGKFLGIPQTGANNVYGFESYASDVGMYYELRAVPADSPLNITLATARSTFPSVAYSVPNAWGTNYKNYEGLKNAMNTEGQQFRVYDGSTRHAQSTWRIGIRLRQFDESNEYAVRTSDPQVKMGGLPFSSAWGQYNLRGGHIHTAWLGANVNYTESNPGKAWEWNPGGNYINVRGHRSNDDPGVQGIPNNSGQFTLPPFGTTTDLSGVESFVFYEIPRPETPIVSLAQFQNAQLSYQNYQPGNVIGWSFQDVRSERGATVVRPGKAGTATVNPQDDISQSTSWNSGHYGLIQKGNGHTDDILLYDMAFEVNQRLFDHYFLSTIPYSGSGSSWNRKTVLPNGRLRPFRAVTDSDAQDVLGSLEKSFNRSATLLGNYGAFNVNSTSVGAWVAHLSGLRGLQRESLATGSSPASPFSRFQMPGAMSSASPDWKNQAAWNASRGLSDDEIRTLAEGIVEEVKLRGPFLSLSDFVNRRLVDAPASASSQLHEDAAANSLEATGRSGALDAAIRRAQLNAALETSGSGSVADRLANGEQVFTEEDRTNGYIVYGSQPDFKTIGLPGYLTQGDLLSSLAPTLTARGDTFTVRAYGEARDKTGNVTARSWCEAVVQRSASYLDNKNDPATRALIPTSASNPILTANPDLSALNKRFGRRFEIVSLRWLNSKEV